MIEEGFKPIIKQINEQEQNIELPAINVKQSNPTPKVDVIKELPNWNIEPPLEIKRGNL